MIAAPGCTHGIATPHGRLDVPAFLPDGSRAVVRSLDAEDLERSGVRAIMVNVFHLSNSPGTSVIHQAGGIHSYMGWRRPVMSDSGGFQILSLMSAAGARACVTERGLSYRHGPSKRILTPAKSIRRQLRLGADVVFCLDYCTHPDEPTEAQARSVRYTVKWARECKAEFERALSERTADGPRPALFAVVQGGADPELRRQCADALIALGFDGYGFGGWPVASDGRLVEAVGWVADLLPKEAPKHGLGIGKPENIVAAWRAGYTSFDSTLPTRDARRGRLFVARDLAAPLPAGGSFYEYLYIADEAHRRSDQPIDSTCSCLCCSRYSRGYLRHLFDVKDGLAHRLASLHNLSFYARLMEAMRGEARAS